MKKRSDLLVISLLLVFVVSCGRRPLRPEQGRRNQIFAEILKREDLRKLGNDDFFPTQLRNSAEPQVQQWCALALGRIGDPRALPWLYEALHAPYAAVRATAAFAVGETEDQSLVHSEGRSADAHAVSALVPLLNDPAIQVRARATEAIGKIGTAPDALPIIQRMENYVYNGSPEELVFLNCVITSLTRLKNNAARPVLTKLAAIDNPEIQWRVANDLYRMRDREALPVLDRNIRNAAAQLLKQAGTAGVPDHPGPSATNATDQTYTQAAAARQERTIAEIATNRGTMEIELFRQDAPLTVANFITLANRGFFNGLQFMRVVPYFVIQGGDPRNEQEGGPGYSIRCEINMHPFERGSVGMALSGKDTGGSQFFITLSPQPHLDGGYTCFGRVISGMPVVEHIVAGDRIQKIRIREEKTIFDFRRY